MPTLSHSHKEAIVSAPIAALLEALFVMLRVRVDRHLARTRKSWLAFNGHWPRAAAAVEVRAAREWRYAAYACRARQTTLRVAT